MIVVVGLSHRTASIAVREKLAIEPEKVPEILRGLLAEGAIGEALLVSTCNRVELVAAGRQGPLSDLEAVARSAQAVLAAHAPEVASHLYVHQGAEAVRHLFRVAASLDSIVLGEPQILGQLKEAFEVARRAGTLGSTLHRAVPRAIRAAKRVRTETAIGAGQVSVPSVAVDLARQIFSDLAGRAALLVGSGEMAEGVALLLRAAGSRLSVIGRNEQRTLELARAVSGEPRRWEDLEAALVQADVVVTSTSAPGHVVDFERVQRARKSRRGRSLFFIDLAVPRDVDPRVERLDGIFLYNIDDFERVVAESLSGRKREAERGERIVLGEVQGWERWAEAAQATPAIVALRARFRGVLRTELDRSLRGKLKHLGGEERQALETMLEASLKKMLHAATVRLRGAAVGEGEPAEAGEAGEHTERLERLTIALNELFALDGRLDADLEGALDHGLESDPAAEGDFDSAPATPDEAPDIRRKGRKAS